MPANPDPIYTKVGDTSTDGTATSSSVLGPTFTTAAADYTGATATHNKVVFTADATNGSYIERLRFKAIGTNTASVARIFMNNGGAATSAGNNVFFGEITLPATAASNVAATAEVDYPMGFALPPGFRIVVGLGTTVAAGWVCTAIGGKY